MQNSIKETMRYLGYKNGNFDQETLDLATNLMCELEQKCSPRSTYMVVDITINDAKIDFGYFKVRSQNLAKNLKNCKKCVLFAATLGTEADFLIRRYSVSSITKSVVINACASALIEEVCDKLQTELKNEINGYFRPRFSPGYGDFSIEHQKDMVKTLETSKKIGLTLSDSLILMPTKSVTAIIGISENDEKCILSGCEVCLNINCEYKRG